MNALKKNKIKTVMKYTWPFYLISAILIVLGLYFIFRLIHKVPDYKTLTLFISGEVKDEKKLRDDLAKTEVETEAASMILPFLLIKITPYLRLEKSFNK